MITINLSDKQAAELKSMINSFMPTRSDSQRKAVDEIRAQINNQQFDVSDFESSRQYEALIVNAAYLTNLDKATKK
ncbi:hypothetical protein OAJGMMKP_00062 [Escherichia phage vB_EcoS-12397IV]|uniref:Uncharacterized protein n=33 Tax=Veterinaerplatzvirus vv12210I TaxID=2844167 RepID=A0A5P1M2W8_9CAUD|nr:hypothetical protein H1N77_gp59 [Escherichia phage vB_EcoS-12210I]QDJ98067.1 hypothetical protein LNEMGHCG_00035 [Escherichia phage vB_EcoS-12397I]QDJ98115.1 hypothetical protein AKDFDEBO_00017 [Escherichia phage vB_EcoS-12397II]QDJ98167.1 hypothetical protein BFFAFCJP_00003 [Escherichia phage vB_EcoS-12397III]QDJ98291.1 hypothetical protein OAJGMMKP_00062 [Escherichia phage vB_EcoS-12397IV]QDJ98351.1 hypothetical protein PCBGKBDD_00056 [Escherichia phage vB_EcoS-12469I]QDJ98403.1 hypothet